MLRSRQARRSLATTAVTASPCRVVLCASPWILLALSLGGNLLQAQQVADLQGSQSPLDHGGDTFARELASTGSDSAAGSNEHGEDGGGHHEGPHQHDSLLFLFNALVIGAAIMHISSVYPWLQQTVVLFVIGLIFSLVLEGLHVKDYIGVFGDSYDMWMGIDPHLLLFALLPALLAGDAMSIDCHVGQQVMYQCLWLAGPGVAIQGMIAAGFLSLYLDWPFLLSLVTASILCATDPVAVVALLKELGVSPTLTVQIQGESLVNDGTAIVLYTVAYNMLSGTSYDVAEIVMFLVKVALMACALGAFIGYIFFTWIRASGNRLRHHSSMIQIALTICCAYWSFIFAEGVLHISGVLATVTASLVLAKNMWPHVVSPESVHHVWHTIEALGNIVIFFLAGALTGSVMVKIISFKEIMNLLVIYIVLLIIRGSFIYVSRPLLKRLSGGSADHIKVSRADAAVMTWGGLRGAVGLALAIQVHNGRAPNEYGQPQLDEHDAMRVLFYVSGIAFLTLIINATTAPLLLAWLGMTGLPEAQLRLLRMLSRRLVGQSEKDNLPDEVTSSLKHMFGEIEHEISHTSVLKDDPTRSGPVSDLIQTQNPKGGSTFGRSSKRHDVLVRSAVRKDTLARGRKWADATWASQRAPPGTHEMMRRASITSTGSYFRNTKYQDNMILVERHQAAEAEFMQTSPLSPRFTKPGNLPGNGASILVAKKSGNGVFRKGFPAESLLGKVKSLVDVVQSSPVDSCMAKVVNKAFLSLVKAHYWKQIEGGDLQPGSEEADILLTSVEMALSPLRADLLDFTYVKKEIPVVPGDASGQLWRVITGDKLTEPSPQPRRIIAVPSGDTDAPRPSMRTSGSSLSAGLPAAPISTLLRSVTFNTGISLAIVVNCMVVAVEEAVRDDRSENMTVWYVLEATFTLIFTLECILKVSVLRRSYFMDVANVFDFLLVILGIIGLSISTVELSSFDDGDRMSHWASIIRIARVFRVLRFLRVFRLFHAKLSDTMEIDPVLSLHMVRIATLMSFIGAHLHSQELMLRYFGGDEAGHEDDAPEVARCILQSQISVYKALELAQAEERQMDDTLRTDLKVVYDRKEITESLEAFVMSAFHSGAIGASEAESMVHPLHHEISECVSVLNDCSKGIIQANMRRASRVSCVDADVSIVPLPSAIPEDDASRNSIPFDSALTGAPEHEESAEEIEPSEERRPESRQASEAVEPAEGPAAVKRGVFE